MSPTLVRLAQDIAAVSPEVILAATAVAVGVWGGFAARPTRAGFSLLAATGVLVAGTWAARLPEMIGPAFEGRDGALIEVEPVGIYLRYLFLLAAVIAAVAAHVDRRLDDRHYGEFLCLVLLITAGAGLLVSARHLLVAYLAFELLSVPAYALAGFVADDRRSAEGGVKYAVYGGASSAALLYGLSILYGLTGTLFYAGIAERLASTPHPPLAMAAAAALVFAGLAYKVSVVPFHWWAPDAYEGAPATVAGFLSVCPKAAGFGFLLALGDVLARSPACAAWFRVLAAAAAATMTFGNLCAMWQTSTQRLLAYSSIAHAGYMLVGVWAHSALGTTALLFYVTAYLLMNLGAFYVVGLAGADRLPLFKGLGWRAPVVGVSMAVFLFSLTGLPPLAGFVGKALLLVAALDAGGRTGLALALLIAANTVVSLFYYAEIVRRSFLERPDEGAPPLEVPRFVSYALGLLATGVVLLGLAWNGIAEIVKAAAGA